MRATDNGNRGGTPKSSAVEELQNLSPETGFGIYEDLGVLKLPWCETNSEAVGLAARIVRFLPTAATSYHRRVLMTTGIRKEHDRIRNTVIAVSSGLSIAHTLDTALIISNRDASPAQIVGSLSRNTNTMGPQDSEAIAQAALDYLKRQEELAARDKRQAATHAAGISATRLTRQ